VTHYTRLEKSKLIGPTCRFTKIMKCSGYGAGRMVAFLSGWQIKLAPNYTLNNVFFVVVLPGKSCAALQEVDQFDFVLVLP